MLFSGRRHCWCATEEPAVCKGFPQHMQTGKGYICNRENKRLIGGAAPGALCRRWCTIGWHLPIEINLIGRNHCQWLRMRWHIIGECRTFSSLFLSVCVSLGLSLSLSVSVSVYFSFGSPCCFNYFSLYRSRSTSSHRFSQIRNNGLTFVFESTCQCAKKAL